MLPPPRAGARAAEPPAERQPLPAPRPRWSQAGERMRTGPPAPAGTARPELTAALCAQGGGGLAEESIHHIFPDQMHNRKQQSIHFELGVGLLSMFRSSEQQHQLFPQKLFPHSFSKEQKPCSHPTNLSTLLHHRAARARRTAGSRHPRRLRRNRPVRGRRPRRDALHRRRRHTVHRTRPGMLRPRLDPSLDPRPDPRLDPWLDPPMGNPLTACLRSRPSQLRRHTRGGGRRRLEVPRALLVRDRSWGSGRRRQERPSLGCRSRHRSSTGGHWRPRRARPMLWGRG